MRDRTDPEVDRQSDDQSGDERQQVDQSHVQQHQMDPKQTQASQMEASGPTSIAGVEAGDLPGGGRGSVDTEIGKAMARKTPDRTGGTIDGDVGIRGMPNAADAAKSGTRGKN